MHDQLLRSPKVTQKGPHPSSMSNFALLSRTNQPLEIWLTATLCLSCIYPKGRESIGGRKKSREKEKGRGSTKYGGPTTGSHFLPLLASSLPNILLPPPSSFVIPTFSTSNAIFSKLPFGGGLWGHCQAPLVSS